MSATYKAFYDLLRDRVSVSQFERVLGKTMYRAIISYNRYTSSTELDLADLLLKSLGNDAVYTRKFQEFFITNVISDDDLLVLAIILKVPVHNKSNIRDLILQKNTQLLAVALQQYMGFEVERISTTNKSGQGESNVCNPERKLHDYQKKIKDDIVMMLLQNPRARMVVHMPTGSGKTKTCVEAITDFIRTRPYNEGLVIWFAHSNELCQQAYESMKSVWNIRGDYDIPILKVFGDNDPVEELYKYKNGVIFIGFPKFVSLSQKADERSVKFRSYLATNAQLVVIDEAHKSLARTYEKAITYVSSMPNCRLIGLTATPGRANNIYDNSNETLAEMFGGKLVTITDDNLCEVEDQIAYLQERGYLARIDHRTIDIDLESFSDQDLQRIEMQGELDNEHIEKIVESPIRNKAIIDEITKCVGDPNKDHVLVFASSMSHCYILKALLFLNNIKSDVVTGETDENVRQMIISDFKEGRLRVLINYGVLSTGFDAPRLKSLIIARHTNSLILYSQMIGRALRGTKNGGNDLNYVVDLIDNISQLGNPGFLFRYWEDFWGRRYKQLNK